MSRIWNFSAGPSTLPLEVLEEAREEFVDYRGAGMSIVEMSHRSRPYEEVHEAALADAKAVFGAPDDVRVLFVQGGATLQFAMVPMNLLRPGLKAGYVDTGVWASKALADAALHGEVETIWSGETEGYRRAPRPDEVRVDEHLRYVHVTSNETIGGVQYHAWPDPGVPMVADMSSDLLSRPIPWERFDLVYGGVQKNLGPAGAAIVFVRESVLETTRRDLAHYLRYDVHADRRSLYNTPPVFTIWMVGKVLRWIRREGGLEAMARRAEEKANLLYGAIDGSGGFYSNPVEPDSRSRMNVVFRLPSPELETRFVAEAEEAGLSGLKGHRSVGGCRASIYNAMPVEGVRALVEFMDDFLRRHG
ncbi:MAG TPA: 3-phosphoserine/phosphohydroxythreonine transaminase [Actinobacteria bacterium]|nr:3-phosphoserine/phosphohydroxythreonine transaminase [Actinomycetota bacterium]